MKKTVMVALVLVVLGLVLYGAMRFCMDTAANRVEDLLFTSSALALD